MKYQTLPQLCCRCYKMKSPDQGRFIKSRHKYSRWLWLCTDCSNRTVWRDHRQGHESHYEKIVREALQAVFPCYIIKAEYKVGAYLFDFAVTDLRLLLEINPHSTHSSVGRKIRDWKKSKVAKEKGWKLVRLVPYPPRELAQRAVQAVRKHYESLFAKADRQQVEKGKSSDTGSAVESVVKRWANLFHRFYVFQYQFKPGDVEGLEYYLANYPDAVPDRLIEVFWTAWCDAKEKPRQHPISAGAVSMKYFFENLRKIMHELGYKKDYVFQKTSDFD